MRPAGSGGDPGPSPAPISLLRRVVFGVAATLVFVVLVGLGTWQVERRAWKLDLIAQVDARVHAPAVPAPGPADWPRIGPDDAYRHVTLSGTFLHDRETLVQAVTERGGGFWVLTPLRRPDGSLVLINRGFVPGDRRDPASRAAGQLAGETTVTGLLRLTEPKGAFLRANDPKDDRWYSRDVAAIAAARGLTDVAPYFVDADATPNPGGLPVGGLTVIAFPNNHLVYAITWYGMALMLAGAVVYVLRGGRARDGAAEEH
ncbi:SURF1 family protein [Methylobacterium mesophilicum SR1.6/6]|uniref:SURF1-like protein n=1 Tax=Methylobacterium mesophilicum SR1.6/6 TaxID=908290 RepID=A0A6B9FU87_9HYPH|nr:SURF1 family protein [Methylobacterium mesophilicum]QGY04668.1 SURF1 family protein [Methylobacterium mesophilicum SR1.6/6]